MFVRHAMQRKRQVSTKSLFCRLLKGAIDVVLWRKRREKKGNLGTFFGFPHLEGRKFTALFFLENDAHSVPLVFFVHFVRPVRVINVRKKFSSLVGFIYGRTNAASE